MKKLNITVWNEFQHEKKNEEVKKIYPDGMHSVIASFLSENDNYEVITATLDEPEHGLTDEVLNNTDVLFWWGHTAHHLVSDEIVDKVHKRILEGMGLIVLHSGHFSKIFKKINGTTCNLKWREDDRERLWVVNPSHPITDGIPEHFDIPGAEMYGEPFDIATPDDLVFISWFEGGEVFRSGCCFHRGAGKIFYFRPGHELTPVFKMPVVQKILKNAVEWAKPINTPGFRFNHFPSLEEK